MPIINDFVVREDICNMRCDYCLTGTSNFKKNELFRVNTRDDSLFWGRGSELEKNMNQVTNSISEVLDVSILKLSGGEILLIKGLIDFIREQALKHKVVQILTNGMLLTHKFIEQIKEMNNVCLQISLDHHSLQGNIYRTKTQKQLDYLLSNLDMVIQANIPTEINCVLHDKNTPIIKDFADYLLRYNKRVTLYPFPIRGRVKEKFYPSKEHLIDLNKLINNYSKYKGILPPIEYMKCLQLFMENGERNIKCIFPQVAIGSFDDGTITPCANYWFISLGNILQEDKKTVLNRVYSDKIYNVLLNDKHWFKECKHCFTPWEVLNLYAIGKISTDELCALPLYSYKGVRESIVKLFAKEQNLYK